MKLENELVKNHFSILISVAAATVAIAAVDGGSRAVCIASVASAIPF